MLLEAHGHRREYVDVYRSWGKFLRRAGREEEALEVLERATDLAAEQVARARRPTSKVISAAVRPRGPFSLRATFGRRAMRPAA